MTIKNQRNHPVELRYKGLAAPLKLAAGETSNNIPSEVRHDPVFKRDLINGRVGMMLSPSDAAGVRSRPVDKPGQQPPPRNPADRKQREPEDKSIVDLVANELAARLMLLKPEFREAELAKYKRSANPNFLNAVKETERRMAEAVAEAPPAPRADTTAAVHEKAHQDFVQAVKPSQTILKAPETRPEGSRPATVAAPTPVVVATPVTEAAVQENMNRNQLMKLAKARGLEVSSKMTAKDLVTLVMGAK